MVIIPPHRGMNQSQDEYQFNHRENTKGQETTNFSPEVHVLAVTPLVFSFHICTAFHEHEHHASLRELISHET